MTYDPSPGQQRMFAWIAGLPDQLRRSGEFPGLDGFARLSGAPAQILVCGMGGSAMAGSLLGDEWPGMRQPVLVHRDYGLPGWAGPETLVVACSHSGETAETLSAVAEARRRGCPLAGVASGGRLLELAHGKDGGAGFPAVVIPGGQPPRTALGASFGALLHLMHRLGLAADPAPAIAAAVAQAEADELVILDGGKVGGDAAAQLVAKDLAGRFTVIYTSGRQAHGAGRRLLAQLNENAKAPGHAACFPELDHNEVVGWNLSETAREDFALVVLRSADETAAEARRVDVTVELLADQFAAIHQITARGPDDLDPDEQHLSRVLGLILFGDLISAHVAVATAVDPVPITRIDTLKSRLAGS